MSNKWRVATSLLTLRNQINSLYPARNKASDGTISDSHSCGGPGKSDHCPRDLGGSEKVVTAMDITHDPACGCDAERIVDALAASRDERIKYIRRRRFPRRVLLWGLPGPGVLIELIEAVCAAGQGKGKAVVVVGHAD